MSSNIRIQRIGQNRDKEITAKTMVTKYCSDDWAKRVSVAVELIGSQKTVAEVAKELGVNKTFYINEEINF